MNNLLIAGTIIVTAALLSYSIAIITEQVKKILTKTTLVFLTIGIVLDVIATMLMILGSPQTPFTLHGFVGYSALLVMMIDATLIWRSYFTFGFGSKISHGLHLYSRYAYLWWVLAFITGGILVAVK